MTLCGPNRTPNIEHFGVAIRKFGRDQNHVAALYVKNGEVRMCHLAAHHDLKNERFCADYYWAETGLPDDLARLVGAKFQAIADNDVNARRVAYGFNYDTEMFDSNLAEFREQPEGRGLTCATFLLCVAGSLGIQFLDLSDFGGSPEDDTWRRSLVQFMKSAGASKEHCKAALENADVRVRPEHTVCGVMAKDIPVASEVFTKAGAEIDDFLKSSIGI